MLHLCNIAKNILSCLLQLVSQWHEEMYLSRIYHSNRFHIPGLFVLVTCFLVFSVWLFTTTSCKSTLRHCTVFWLKWPVHYLVLVFPPPPPPSTPYQSCQQYKTMLKTWRNNVEWRRGVVLVRYLTDL